jgi:hypothetical protein
MRYKPYNDTLSEIMPEYSIKNECPEKRQQQRKSSDTISKTKGKGLNADALYSAY